MRVRARVTDRDAAPAPVRAYLSAAPQLTAGAQYEVHAAAVFEGLFLLQIVDDSQYPSWKPAWLFEVTDRSIPRDWICSLFSDEPSMVIGPDFLARSLDSYNAMVELDPDQVANFWQRVARTSPAG